MPFFIVPLILLSASIIEEPLFTDCSTADRYGVDSPFQTNLRKLLNTLPSLTSPTGFNNTSEGEPPDKVYGQALCRGDVSSAACEDCVDNASWEILKECNTKEAIIWYQLCQVHYSSQNFFGSDVYNVKYPSWNDQERLESGDTVWFNEEVDRLLRGLIARAAYEPTKRMFATGAAKVSKGITIYALVQCTRDLSGDDCKKCLQTVAEELLDDRRQGGILLSRNCNVRFEVNRFYNVTGDNFEPVDILVEINEIRKNEQGKWKADGICVHLETGPKWKNGVIVYVVCGATVLLIFLSGFCVICHCRETRKRSATMRQEDDLASLRELPCVDLATIRVATNDFSDDNKIGRGGFGIIYKGVMPDGKEIAVKRLTRKSWQGMEEFKSEVTLIAQLQHRNLVRLLGFGMEEEEKLLIYEFMPNKSLDTFTFDSERRGALTWKMYYSIIGGIARGLLYLHEDSRLKIIHRDLKPSNILLDHDMVAKISDFGMARIFGEDQNTANTKRVTGTYGYMAPEYAMEGLFSTKSDVYSFGVILLEIISGKKNRSFYLNNEKSQTLLTYAWRLWNEGRQLELVDPALKETSSESEVERCINIGLLCVQQDPDDRPQMSSVVAMLGSDQLVLPRPRKPSSSFSRIISPDQSSSGSSTSHITSSAVSPR